METYAYAKTLVSDLHPRNNLRFVGPNRSSVLDESKRPAGRTEDSNRRRELEETLGNFRERLRYRNCHPRRKRGRRRGEPWQPGSMSVMAILRQLILGKFHCCLSMPCFRRTSCN